MVFRLVMFLLFQGVGGLAGWYLWPEHISLAGALTGVVAGGVAWTLLDLSRGMRVLQWLRSGNTAEAPVRIGLWGEVSDRMRRLIRAREQQIRESETRLHDFLAALQASPNGVLLLDAQGRIEWFNQTAASHFGLDVQRDLLQHFGNLVRDPAFAAYVAGADYSHDVTMPGRDNTLSRPVRLSAQLHPYGEGRRLLLSRDVTALEQAEAMRRDFVANVSHEIRTPLTVLSGFVETLQSLPLDEAERARYLALMAQQAQRMQILVSDLLTLSRLEGSPLPGAGEWMSVRQMMQQLEQEGRALSAVLTHSSGPGHQLSFETLQDAEISGASGELLSAMSNLVSNAIRYTPAGGVVKVSWQMQDDGRAEFSVFDSGPGIAPEHLPRLTERFYRVDRGRSRDSGGTGLGLAIVKHVAQRHGAELKIESTLGKGSRFSIVFPAVRVRHS
jgi:two-component system, OmpR family, phosphate regulon sensor histidine kinase PhoR